MVNCLQQDISKGAVNLLQYSATYISSNLSFCFNLLKLIKPLHLIYIFIEHTCYHLSFQKRISLKQFCTHLGKSTYYA